MESVVRTQKKEPYIYPPLLVEASKYIHKSIMAVDKYIVSTYPESLENEKMTQLLESLAHNVALVRATLEGIKRLICPPEPKGKRPVVPTTTEALQSQPHKNTPEFEQKDEESNSPS